MSKEVMRKLMQWSPILSHLVMIVLGMGLHQILAPVRSDDTPRMRGGRVYIVLPKKMQIYGEMERGSGKVGFVLRDKGERCRLVLRGVNVHDVPRRKIVMSVTMAKSSEVLAYLRAGKIEGVFAEGDVRAKRLPECNRRPKVVYGVR